MRWKILDCKWGGRLRGRCQVGEGIPSLRFSLFRRKWGRGGRFFLLFRFGLDERSSPAICIITIASYLLRSSHPTIQKSNLASPAAAPAADLCPPACLPLFFFLGFGAPLHLTHPYLPNLLLLLEGACWIVLPSSSASIGIWWGDVAECWSSSPNKQKGKGEREMIDAWDQL